MSKRIIEHPPESPKAPKYWRSTGQLEGTPEFKAIESREFQPGASELNPEVGRRAFLKYMGASTALAGLSLSACRREEKTLVPFTQSVEWSVPGKPVFYATSRPDRRGSQPLVATTHDGRPTKLDGNPLHEATAGASSLHSQSALLDLYDPDRSRHFQFDGKAVSEADFIKWTAELVKTAGDGAALGFLFERNPSPTLARLRQQLAQKFPKAAQTVYEPLENPELATGRTASFGAGFAAVPLLDKADVILALDSNFLGADEGSTAISRAFAQRRKPEQKMNRLYVVESRYTVTGGGADHRLRVPASKVGAVAKKLAEAIGAATAEAGPLKELASAYKAAATFTEVQEKWIAEAAKDLVAQRGKALVLVGSRQPAAVQALGQAINAALGALGATLEGRALETSTIPATTLTELTAKLVSKEIKTLFIVGGNPVYNAPADLKFGEAIKRVDVVRFGYYEDETSLSLELDADGNVTKRNFVKWHVPAAHFLEAWGDGLASDGTYLSQQPMILPLFGGWSEIQLLNLLVTGAKSEGLDLVQETFRATQSGITAESWAKFLHDGFVAGSAAKSVALKFDAAAATALVGQATALPEGIEIVFVPCNKVDDGRYANNAWLQEMPDPITKLTWDNAALISPVMAEKLGFGAQGQDAVDTFRGANGQWITIEVEIGKDAAGKAEIASLEIPVYVAPGHADNSISIALGYGRSHEGKIGGREGNYLSHGGLLAKKTQVGFNAYVLRASNSGYIAIAKSVTKLDTKKAKTKLAKDDFAGGYLFAITQEHGAIEGRGPDIVREATLETFEKNNNFARDKHWLEERHAMDAEAEKTDAKNYPMPNSFYSHPELHDKNHQWGMIIDLTTCTGCSSCMVACQAENNIPVVGKEQVHEGRELHWIRMDRYFVSTMNDREEKHGGSRKPNVDEPRMVMQPMPCQHCENAPCETVCPVNATVHSDDGLNVMAYNRCIGTRYCANNCPFKVRRFNFFDFNERQKETFYKPNLLTEKSMAETLKLSKNPNVTVRMRGVMEKCTFCVQRVQEAKIAAKVAAKDSSNVKVPTDSFTTACAQVCASGAITFGNRLDKQSAVAKLWDENGRNYRLLDYIGVNARVSYLARVMNINPKMPDVPVDFPELHANAHTDAKEGVKH